MSDIKRYEVAEQMQKLSDQQAAYIEGFLRGCQISRGEEILKKAAAKEKEVPKQ